MPSKRAVGALTSELYGPNPKQAAETARSLRQLSTDTTMKRTQPGPPVAWIWAGVAILAVLLISVLFWAMSISNQPGGGVPSSARIVPDVTGMTYERANTEIGDADLISFRVDEPNSEVAVGNLIRTDPAAGRRTSGRRLLGVPGRRGLASGRAAAAADQRRHHPGRAPDAGAAGPPHARRRRRTLSRAARAGPPGVPLPRGGAQPACQLPPGSPPRPAR